MMFEINFYFTIEIWTKNGIFNEKTTIVK